MALSTTHNWQIEGYRSDLPVSLTNLPHLPIWHIVSYLDDRSKEHLLATCRKLYTLITAENRFFRQRAEPYFSFASPFQQAREDALAYRLTILKGLAEADRFVDPNIMRDTLILTHPEDIDSVVELPMYNRARYSSIALVSKRTVRVVSRDKRYGDFFYLSAFPEGPERNPIRAFIELKNRKLLMRCQFCIHVFDSAKVQYAWQPQTYGPGERRPRLNTLPIPFWDAYGNLQRLLELSDGRLAAALGNAIHIWHLDRNEEDVLEHQFFIHSLIQLHDGKLAFYCSPKIYLNGQPVTKCHTVHIWDLDGNEQLKIEHPAPIESLVQLQDGRLATKSGRMVYIWNLDGSESLVNELPDPVESLVVLEDGRLLIQSGTTAHIWGADGNKLFVLEYPDITQALSVLKDGRFAIRSGSGVHILGLDGVQQYALEHPDTIKSVVELQDGRLAIACGRTLCVWALDKDGPLLLKVLDELDIKTFIELEEGRLAIVSGKEVLIRQVQLDLEALRRTEEEAAKYARSRPSYGSRRTSEDRQ